MWDFLEITPGNSSQPWRQIFPAWMLLNVCRVRSAELLILLHQDSKRNKKKKKNKKANWKNPTKNPTTPAKHPRVKWHFDSFNGIFSSFMFLFIGKRGEVFFYKKTHQLHCLTKRTTLHCGVFPPYLSHKLLKVNTSGISSWFWHFNIVKKTVFEKWQLG